MFMTYNKAKFLYILTISLLIFVALGIVSPKNVHAQSAYSNSNLINDAVYLNSNSMNQAQIQLFLVSQDSYLASYSSYSGRDNANVLASQIIYEASQDYGINPQVIMATIQKEQSLITDPSPAQSQLD